MLLLPTVASGAQTPTVQVPAAGSATTLSPSDAQGVHLLLGVLAMRYAEADTAHETKLATLTRVLAQGTQRRVLELRPQLAARNAAATDRAVRALAELRAMLAPTEQRFQPWPPAFEVNALSARAQSLLGEILTPPRTPQRPYRTIDSALAQAQNDALAGREGDASFAVLRAYALYGSGLGQRLQDQEPALDSQITADLLIGSTRHPSLAELIAQGAGAHRIASAEAAVSADMNLTAQVLREVQISHTTIVVNAAIIVFREGLEIVLILATLTASLVGAKRYLRRPILLGALAGLLASVLTWLVAQVLLNMFGNGGLELQAVTGLVAVALMLLITNWFFHRIYWSQWIARFNRKRKSLQRRGEVRGFLSGQVLGMFLLGLSSVYRDGLETVLFLQVLKGSAGTATTALGAGIGLGGTLIVAAATFALQRRLPFKRMLMLTGVLITLVLVVMVGTTVQNMQGVGWLPITPTSFSVPINLSTWMGIYPTWEGIVAQIASPLFVLGSYFAAREIRVKRPQRRARAEGTIVAGVVPEV